MRLSKLMTKKEVGFDKNDKDIVKFYDDLQYLLNGNHKKVDKEKLSKMRKLGIISRNNRVLMDNSSEEVLYVELILAGLVWKGHVKRCKK